MAIDSCKNFFICSCILGLALYLHGCADDEQSSPAPGPVNASQEFGINSTLTFSLSADPDAILADQDAREVVESSVIRIVANDAQVAAQNVAINSLFAVSIDSGRRLAVDKFLRVDYTITVEEENKANIALARLRAVYDTASMAEIKTRLNAAIAAVIESLPSEKKSSLESQFGTLTVVSVQAVGSPELYCTNCVSSTEALTTSGFLAITPSGLSFPRNDQLDAEFLMQATFGPTRSSLKALGTKSYVDWIKEQIELPIESHRAYYRKRVNPRHPETMQIGEPFHKCDKNSRWSGVAFTKMDFSKSITVSGNRVLVDGVWRTDIDPAGGTGNLIPVPTEACTDTPPNNWQKRDIACADKTLNYQCRFNEFWTSQQLCRKSCYDQGVGYDGDDCSDGWHLLGDYDGFICDIEDENVGSWLQLATDDKCKENRKGMRNPAFWMADSNIATVAPSALIFQTLPGKEDVLLLQTASSTCSLTEYLKYSGRYFVYDPRLQLLENTLEYPASAPTDTDSSGTDEVCATVPKTFLNDNHCKLAATCTPLHLQKAMVRLDATSFKKFHTIGSKYLYEVVGLRPEKSPCGALSRWVQCMACAETTSNLPVDDIQAIQNALVLHEGRIRDIIVPCNAQDIPATVGGQALIVKVDSLFFEYTHLNEHNVYDFTEWVDAHPGGAARIKKWAGSPYDFTMTFPSSHEMTRWSQASTQERLDFIGKAGDDIDFRDLPSALQTQELAKAFDSEGSTGYFQACGSPFEVANEPAKGHSLSMFAWLVSDKDNYADTYFDNSFLKTKQSYPVRDVKQQVWFMKALYSTDQLRQRMSWALSQIFVTSAVDDANDWPLTEIWVNYYDIFVRNGFGNLRDIIREVTYSPVMANYLTFLKNRAFDVVNNFPDENYAREIQQLFTIGLWKLNLDGTKQMQDGIEIPTYDNDDIMNFARVFTGLDLQLPRSNVEQRNNLNYIDPLRIHAPWHDVYPKPDLNKNYLGDGYPLCADIPPRGFLKSGAEFEFLGYSYDGQDVMILSENSNLFSELCRNAAGSTDCQYKLKIVLGSDVACTGRECAMDTVRVVKVGLGYFEHVPPTCVHLFFYNGILAREGGRRWWWLSRTKCANPDTIVAGTSCCSVSPDAEERICAYSNERVRFSIAEENCVGVGKNICNKRTSKASCGYDSMHVWTPENCSLAVEIDSFGKVSLQTDDKTKQNKVTVQWQDGFPASSNCPSSCTARETSCVCDITVDVKRVFDSLPTKTQAENNLKVGSFPPKIGCTSSCTGEVRVYAPTGSIDESTIFEVGGQFFKNIQSSVAVAGGYEFRNPPVFALQGFESQRSVSAEIEALHDHLFLHPNTPPFISYRLIQRLTTSTPSATYVRDVADAFKTGEYSGVSYSGKYGDLAATVTAILLHPEARNPGESTTFGQLREPVVKLVHFLRALEYYDRGPHGDREVLIRNLDEKLGQAPFMSPSVFNFYFVDYQPPRLSGAIVAPEFQIFTPPYWINFLNGMMALINNGLNSCYGGFGTSARRCIDGYGSFQLENSTTVTDTLAELNLLLTGGRSTSMTTIRDAFESADAGQGFQAAQKALLMSPEFNVLGPSLPGEARHVEPPAQNPAPTSYKALVLLWLGGGADTFNMLVPLGCDMHAQYMAARTNVALTPDQLIEIPAESQVCASFGIHKNLPILKELYSQGKAAFVSNIGPLVEPTDASNFQNGKGQKAQRCVGLFSHSDQTTAAQTLQCQVPGASPKGAGGRMGDALAGSKTVTSFSIAGTNTWSEGFQTHTEIISRKAGAVQFGEYEDLKYVIGNITSKVHRNVYAEEFSQQFREFIASSERLGGLFEAAVLRTAFETTSKLGEQLRQVAKLISLRGMRNAERDLFYVTLSGFDSHSNVAQTLIDKFSEIDGALRAFITELKADTDGVFDKVVIFSQSDFGRTLTSNGPGTDHGWAGNHFVIGGKINGGKIFNKFPTSFAVGSAQDAGRGRLIPKFPWESMLVPIAEWMGLESTQFSAVFPNLGNFNSTFIIPTSSLFKN